MDSTLPRRDLLLALCGAALFPLRAVAQGAKAPRTFVLVHGAWHGAWCWRKVSPLLREQGHQVFAPSLTGLGDRRHLATASVSLTTHVQDIVSLLEAEDLRDVVLVGHSYAGLVVAGVAQRQPERLGQVILLDAFFPAPGRSVQDAVPTLRFEQIAKARGDGWKVPMSAVFTLSALGVRDPADVAWMEPRIADQPVRTFTEPSSVTSATLSSVSFSYIAASSIPAFVQAAQRARTLGWPVRAMEDAGHDAMVTKPRELVDRLLELIRPAA